MADWYDPWCDRSPGHDGGCARLAGVTTALDATDSPAGIAVVIEDGDSDHAARVIVRSWFRLTLRLSPVALDELIEALTEARRMSTVAPRHRDGARSA